MNHPRLGATATLLPDGKVLIAGGYSKFDVTVTLLASAELYDPNTGKFTPTGSMTEARGGHTATLLPDGDVLIAGGAGCRNHKTCSPTNTNKQDTLSSAELYDPATGKFSRTGSMSTHRGGTPATLLADGRVLLATGGDSLAAELYDPRSGRFARTGSVFSYYEGNPTATLLPTGKVLLAGKLPNGPHAELYDPATGKFTAISTAFAPGTTPSALYNGKTFDRSAPDTATRLNDGRVLLFEAGYLETYDAATGAFTPAGFASAPGVWYEPTATLLANGEVLFAGGSLDIDVHTYVPAVASAAIYDPANGLRPMGPMRTARDGQTSTLLPDGSVLIAGGTADGENALATAELFRP
jgi:hypothetical protein